MQLAEHYRRSDPAALALALDALGRLQTSYRRTFDSVDVVLSPVVRPATPLLGAHAPTRQFDELLRAVFDYVSYTPLHNLVGAPAMSIPAGFDPRGLPTGVMFAAKYGGEATLLELAYEIEAAQPWPTAQPSLPISRSMDVL